MTTIAPQPQSRSQHHNHAGTATQPEAVELLERGVEVEIPTSALGVYDLLVLQLPADRSKEEEAARQIARLAVELKYSRLIHDCSVLGTAEPDPELEGVCGLLHTFWEPLSDALDLEGAFARGWRPTHLLKNSSCAVALDPAADRVSFCPEGMDDKLSSYAPDSFAAIEGDPEAAAWAHVAAWVRSDKRRAWNAERTVERLGQRPYRETLREQQAKRSHLANGLIIYESGLLQGLLDAVDLGSAPSRVSVAMLAPFSVDALVYAYNMKRVSGGSKRAPLHVEHRRLLRIVDLLDAATTGTRARRGPAGYMAGLGKLYGLLAELAEQLSNTWEHDAEKQALEQHRRMMSDRMATLPETAPAA